MGPDMGPEAGGEEVMEMVQKNGLDERTMRKALELFRRLEALQELPRFDGACIDFHPEKSAVVFIPWIPTIAEVKNGELPAFLASHGVRRVLVDAMWPGNVGILKAIIESGIEVCVLTRTSALHGWWKSGNKGKPKGLVEWLLRYHPEALRGFKEDIKNDTYDAILLRYVKRKFIKRLTPDYVECWSRRLLFRYALREHQRALNQISSLPIPEQEKEEDIRRSEERLEEKARVFVDSMRRFWPVDELFKELQIGDNDVVAQALACEVLLEVDETKGLKKNTNKAGIRDGPVVKGAKKLIHDGKFAHAVTQLAIKLYGRPPYSEEDKMQVARLKRQIITTVWQFKRRALSRAAWSGEARDRPFELITLAPKGAEAIHRYYPARALDDPGRLKLKTDERHTHSHFSPFKLTSSQSMLPYIALAICQLTTSSL